jgi:endonuclease III
MANDKTEDLSIPQPGVYTLQTHPTNSVSHCEMLLWTNKAAFKFKVSSIFFYSLILPARHASATAFLQFPLTLTYGSLSSLSRHSLSNMPVSTRILRTSTLMLAKKEVSAPGTPLSKKRSTELEVDVEIETTAVVTPSPKKTRRSRNKKTAEGEHREITKVEAVKNSVKKRVVTPEPGSHGPPAGWEDIYALVVELRKDRTAPCDDSGCEALPDRTQTPRDFRFQVLISLMLSSQTKDATVGEAIRSMQKANVLNVESIVAMDASELNSYINKVGFHNNKTKFIKQTVEILKEKFDNDIPPAASIMMELPGVGPKMAYICENVAWNRQTGIGVDTHMHRLFNALNWVKSNTPEQTRVQLESWLPRDKWAEVNLLWVGFGQEAQQFKPKIIEKAIHCSQPAKALRLLKRCGLDYAKEGKKLGIDAEIKAILANNDK